MEPLRRARSGNGFTLIDMLVVMVIVSILAAYGVSRMSSVGENTIYYQAQKMARDIRHMQVLTSTYGRTLKLTVSGTTYGVYCTAAGAVPCDTYPSPIKDPYSGDPFTVTLENGVTLAVTGINPASFDQQGRPLTDPTGTALTSTASTYTLSASGTNVVIAITPLTGFVTGP